MTVIWKFPLKFAGEQVIEIPYEYRILDIQYQKGQLMMWALVNDEVPNDTVTIRIFGTGHEVDHAGDYITTIQEQNGLLVWHIFADRIEQS